MKLPIRSVPLILCALLLGAGIIGAAEGDDKVEFQGKVSAVDLEAKTITVRKRQKDYVFQIDPQRCQMLKDGRSPEASGNQSAAPLGNAQIGDSVVGHLVVEGGKPVVTRLYLTTTPETGVRVKEKPGFIVSPYRFERAADAVRAGKGAIDVRGYRRGSLLVDEESGKIFLVP